MQKKKFSENFSANGFRCRRNKQHARGFVCQNDKYAIVFKKLLLKRMKYDKIISETNSKMFEKMKRNH